MRTSEQIHELVSALAKARADFEPIVRSKTVTVKSDRGSYQFSYAPLEDILAAVADALSAQGLVLVSGIEQGAEGSVVLSTRLMHASGQWLESSVNVGRHAKMQEMGSSLTYARRYAITGLLGISADDDDDANAADGNAMVSQASRQGPPASTNRHAIAVPHPTAEEVDALVAIAEACHEPKEVFAAQLRRIMGLPSAGSRNMLLKRGHRFRLKVVTDTTDDLRRGQRTGRFDNGPLAMNPVRFNGVQPRAFHGQAAGEETHTALPLDALVVRPHPGADLTADVPGGVVPDHHEHPLPCGGHPLHEPGEKVGRDMADWTSLDNAEQEVVTATTQQPIAAQGFGVKVPFGQDVFQQSHRGLCGPGLHRRLGQATPPSLIDKAQGPVGMASCQRHQPVASLFFRAY